MVQHLWFIMYSVFEVILRTVIWCELWHVWSHLLENFTNYTKHSTVLWSSNVCISFTWHEEPQGMLLVSVIMWETSHKTQQRQWSNEKHTNCHIYRSWRHPSYSAVEKCSSGCHFTIKLIQNRFRTKEATHFTSRLCPIFILHIKI